MRIELETRHKNKTQKHIIIHIERRVADTATLLHWGHPRTPTTGGRNCHPPSRGTPPYPHVGWQKLPHSFTGDTPVPPRRVADTATLLHGGHPRTPTSGGRHCHPPSRGTPPYPQWTGAHSALCAFVLPPSFGSAIVRQLKRSGSVLLSKDGGTLSTMRFRTAPVPSALLSFVSWREVTRFYDRWTGAHSALCAFVQPPSKSGQTLFVG